MVTLTIYGPHARLVGEFPMDVVKSVTSYPVQGAQFSKAYKAGRWDGRKHLFNSRTKSFPTGLVSIVKRTLEELDIPVEIVDERVVPVPVESGFELEGVTFDYPYDYQLEACKAMVDHKQGIVKVVTNGGKTEIACAVAKHLGLKTLFIVTTQELLYQGQKRFIKRLGLTESEVGIIGDGQWKPGSFITIATLPTLDSRINTPECVDLLKSMEVVFWDECVDEYSVISTESGYKYAKDINIGDEVVTQLGVKRVTRKTTHSKSGVRITTYAGSFIECSNEHPIAIWRNDSIEYVYADELTIEDVIIERLNPHKKESFNAKAYLAGLFAGDGHWSSRNWVRWAYRKDVDFWEDKVKSLIETTYPDATIRLTINARGDHYLRVSSAEFLKDLSSIGFYCNQNKHKHLSLHPNMGSYIAGLYDTEGYIGKDSHKLHIQTTCKELMCAVQRYLRDFNIPVTLQVCPKRSNKHSTGYRVNIPVAFADEFFDLCNTMLDRKRIPSESRKYKSLQSQKPINNVLLPHKIKRIDHGLILNTVEFEVEEDHTFVANGILTHNCHHMGSDTHFNVSTLCPAYYRFGLSGTPLDRTDGANLRLIASTGEVIFEITNKELVDRGISAKANIIFDKITTPILKKNIRYNTAYKQGVVENAQLLDKVIQWTKTFYKQGLTGLVLCEEIVHGKMIDDALWTHDALEGTFIPHQFIHGEEPSEVRQSALDQFANRELPVLVASVILDEGIDVPSIDFLILAGSRKSRIRTMQRLGRGLRGKKLIVVEFANFCHKYLLEHAHQRLQDYKVEECFPIHYSGPNEDLVVELWNKDESV